MSFDHNNATQIQAAIDAAVAAAVKKVGVKAADLESSGDVFWLLITGVLVFFMQAGFSLLEAGAVREKNVNNILYKNLMDAAIGVIAFWSIGFGIAYGLSDEENPESGFIGQGNFFLYFEDNVGSDGNAQGYANFFFQWAFAATAATIVSGAVAERTKVVAYFFYSFFLTAIIYPVVVHWVWDGDGWLAQRGFVDFAGSGVVHMVGGFAGLVGAIVVGPRQGRFEEKKRQRLCCFEGGPGQPKDIKGHSNLLASLGVAILWVGWYGFNCGSTLAVMNEGSSLLAAKVAVTTTLSAAASAVTATITSKLITDKFFNLGTTLNAALGGLVGITANCAVTDPWQAIIIGFVSCIVYMTASQILVRIHVDDPLDAFPVHGACGIWGILATGIFGSTENFAFAGYSTAADLSAGERFGTQFLGAFCIMCWTVTMSTVLFGALAKSPIGMRVTPDEEKTGLDLAEHGGGAYYRRTIYGKQDETELKTVQTDNTEKPAGDDTSGPN